MKKTDLEDRLIEFAAQIYEICAKTENSDLGKYISQQVIRSGTSPVLNYGEAQGAESQKDFVQKFRISLKELRESHVSLKILFRTDICSAREILLSAIEECNQLIAIFVTSIKTAQKSA